MMPWGWYHRKEITTATRVWGIVPHSRKSLVKTKRKGRKKALISPSYSQTTAVSLPVVWRQLRHSYVFACFWAGLMPKAMDLTGKAFEKKWSDTGMRTTVAYQKDEFSLHLTELRTGQHPGHKPKSDRGREVRGSVKDHWRVHPSSPTMLTSPQSLTVYISYLLTFYRLGIHKHCIYSLWPLSDSMTCRLSKRYIFVLLILFLSTCQKLIERREYPKGHGDLLLMEDMLLTTFRAPQAANQ